MQEAQPSVTGTFRIGWVCGAAHRERRSPEDVGRGDDVHAF